MAEGINPNDIRNLAEVIENLRRTIGGGQARITPTYQDPYPSPFQGRETDFLGPVQQGKYKDYYNRDNTIQVAGAANPQNPDSNIYNREFIWNELHRYANVQVVNRGNDNLFVICSHGGNTFTSTETVLPPGATKYYSNVWAFLLRSPTLGLPYTITEYYMELACCPGTQNVDIIDRCTRLLGQLCVGNSPIDPRDRNWTLDFATDQVDVSGSTVLIGGQPISTTTVNGSTSAQFTPIQKGLIHNVALPGATANFFGADMFPTNTPSGFRVTAAISVPGILRAAITRGGNTQIVFLNNSVALVGGALNVFEFMVDSGDSVNFSYSTTGGTVQIFKVHEIPVSVI